MTCQGKFGWFTASRKPSPRTPQHVFFFTQIRLQFPPHIVRHVTCIELQYRHVSPQLQFSALHTVTQYCCLPLTLVICRVNHIVNVISIRQLIDLATGFLGLKESRRVFLSQGQLHRWGCVSHEPVWPWTQKAGSCARGCHRCSDNQKHLWLFLTVQLNSAFWIYNKSSLVYTFNVSAYEQKCFMRKQSTYKTS